MRPKLGWDLTTSSWLLYRRIVMRSVGIDVDKAALDVIVDGMPGVAPMNRDGGQTSD